MGISLQDQLLKAGLVDKKKADKVRKEKRKQAKQRVKKGQEKPLDETKQAALEAQRKQAQRDRELNQKRKAESDQRALQAQIRQLIEMNEVPLEDGELAYSFNDQGKIKKLLVTDSVHKGLSRGRLAIVRFDERYAVVSTGVADKIALRDESIIVLRNDTVEMEEGEDDPYAEFQVPDDLMW